MYSLVPLKWACAAADAAALLLVCSCCECNECGDVCDVFVIFREVSLIICGEYNSLFEH